MTMIQSPECHREISNKAPACPGCGLPIRDHVTTTQATSKKFKSHLCISHWLMWGGLLSAILLANWMETNANSIAFPYFAILIGTVLYLLTKIRILWHHD
jgi:hypothetical protein